MSGPGAGGWLARMGKVGLAEIPKMTILFLKEKEMYVAQCLEYDVAAQGSTQEAALLSFAKVMATHIALAKEDGHSILDIPEAPKEYFDEAALLGKRI